LTKNNHFNTYNIGSGKGTKIIEVWNKIKEITDLKLDPIFLPRRQFDVSKYILDTKRFSREYH